MGNLWVSLTALLRLLRCYCDCILDKISSASCLLIILYGELGCVYKYGVPPSLFVTYASSKNRDPIGLFFLMESEHATFIDVSSPWPSIGLALTFFLEPPPEAIKV